MKFHVYISVIFLLILFPAVFIHSNDSIRDAGKNSESKQSIENCMFNNIPLHGRVKIVDAFPDIKVQVVDAFPDLDVKLVSSFPNDCGEWEIVESFPDFTVEFVESFPDIKIKFVDSFPGTN